MSYGSEDWVPLLPLILLGLRVAVNDDNNVSPAQLTYGADVRLLADLFVASKSCNRN